MDAFNVVSMQSYEISSLHTNFKYYSFATSEFYSKTSEA